MRNIFIAGANGFIGRHLVQTLKDRYNLYTPSHLRLDLTNILAVEKYFSEKPNIELAINCAITPPYRWVDRTSNEAFVEKIKNDIAIVINLLRVSPFLVEFNSGEAWGGFQKNSEYSAWRAAVISSICRGPLARCLELRPYGVYGPGEQHDRFPTYCFKQITKGESIIIKANREMSWIYVKDLCRIVDMLLSNRQEGDPRMFPLLFKEIDIVHPESLDMIKMATHCMKVVGKDVPILVEGAGKRYVGEFMDLFFNNVAYTPWEDGLKELYDDLQGKV